MLEEHVKLPNLRPGVCSSSVSSGLALLTLEAPQSRGIGAFFDLPFLPLLRCWRSLCAIFNLSLLVLRCRCSAVTLLNELPQDITVALLRMAPASQILPLQFPQSSPQRSIAQDMFFVLLQTTLPPVLLHRERICPLTVGSSRHVEHHVSSNVNIFRVFQPMQQVTVAIFVQIRLGSQHPRLISVSGRPSGIGSTSVKQTIRNAFDDG
mmetsp:Transcript_40697/g.95714  ORF Transcript_40697/g.95714 Transcript_40697/m.95714 type:complete len:208 (-) Transcript_40697:84-707(-)